MDDLDVKADEQEAIREAIREMSDVNSDRHKKNCPICNPLGA